jgi:phage I-like protein
MNESFSDMVNVLGTDVKKAEELIEEGKRARKVLEKAKEHPYEEHLKARRLAYYDEERAKEIVLSKAPEEQKRKISKAQIVVMSKKRSSEKILDAIEQAKQLIKSKFSKDRFRG